MPNTPNYNETSASGTSWQRAVRTVIENPYGGQPYLIFVEEKIYTMDDGKIIREPVANLTVSFDAENVLHGTIYYYLNQLYTVLRDERDNPTPPIIPDIPPASGGVPPIIP
jgi:hypothetical protein